MVTEVLTEDSLLRSSAGRHGTAPPRICIPCLGHYEVSFHCKLSLGVTLIDLQLIFFQTVVEHEKTTNGLAKALTEIGDLLPQVQVTVKLYANDRVAFAVARLYESIMQFLVRAHEWFETGKMASLKRVAQSVVSPFELRYSDILESIRYHSDVLKKLGVSGSQVEVRHVREVADKTNRDVADLSAKVGSMKLESQEVMHHMRDTTSETHRSVAVLSANVAYLMERVNCTPPMLSAIERKY